MLQWHVAARAPLSEVESERVRAASLVVDVFFSLQGKGWPGPGTGSQPLSHQLQALLRLLTRLALWARDVGLY